MEQVVDFTRGDASWIGWLCFPALGAMTLTERARFAGGLLKGLRANRRRITIGLIAGIMFMGGLESWKRLPPQYFIKLHLRDDNVVLSYRWPQPEVAIPFKDITEISTIRAGRRRAKRLQIKTATATFKSFGVRSISDAEAAVLQKLRERAQPASTVPHLN